MNLFNSQFHWKKYITINMQKSFILEASSKSSFIGYLLLKKIAKFYYSALNKNKNTVTVFLYWRYRPLTAIFDSLGRVANLSLEGHVCKQAGFTLSFGGLGCRRAGDIPLPSFLASMNPVSELVETILSITNLEDTKILAEAVDSWRGTSGSASLPDSPRR